MLRPTLRLLLLATTTLVLPAQGGNDPARAFFQKGEVLRVRITLAAEARAALRDKPREYVSAALRLGDVACAAVGVKLKGAAGSFRSIDERPGFTVHLGKFGGSERLHGLTRFHLNNAAQDDTLLCEWLGHEVFSAAGLPAPRVGHAHVWLDDKDMGLYVLRESFDKQFVQRVFGTTKGNLYDGGFCQDVDAALEKDAGDGPDDHSDLAALHELCRGVRPGRAEELRARIDLAGFVDFMALESMLQHWDGYTRNMNNYRLWLPTGGPAVFLPHGMDQLLQDADASVLDHPPAIVASAVLQEPALRKRYRDRLKALLPQLDPDRLLPRLTAVATRLQRELAASDPDAARAHEGAARGLADRLQARYRSLEKQVKAPEPKPLALAVGKPLRLDGWQPAAETEHVALARQAGAGGATLHVHCEVRGDEPRQGKWRRHLLLPRGRYQLRGQARCDDLAQPPRDGDGNEHGGAHLSADGQASARLAGDAAWQALTVDFEVGEFQRTVELACEVRAFVGKAWFKLDSLQLVRLPD